jgi:hypothetical protein
VEIGKPSLARLRFLSSFSETLRLLNCESDTLDRTQHTLSFELLQDDVPKCAVDAQAALLRITIPHRDVRLCQTAKLAGTTGIGRKGGIRTRTPLFAHLLRARDVPHASLFHSGAATRAGA